MHCPCAASGVAGEQHRFLFRPLLTVLLLPSRPPSGPLTLTALPAKSLVCLRAEDCRQSSPRTCSKALSASPRDRRLPALGDCRGPLGGVAGGGGCCGTGPAMPCRCGLVRGVASIAPLARRGRRCCCFGCPCEAAAVGGSGLMAGMNAPPLLAPLQTGSPTAWRGEVRAELLPLPRGVRLVLPLGDGTWCRGELLFGE